MTDHLQAIITVLSLVNPIMCAAIFVQIEAGESTGTQVGSATKVAAPTKEEARHAAQITLNIRENRASHEP